MQSIGQWVECRYLYGCDLAVICRCGGGTHIDTTANTRIRRVLIFLADVASGHTLAGHING